ncbi:Tn7-like element transposition protein TnsE [Bacillus anthracis]|uniref:Tn7-like element transposition protein TnsE n=1 Tax=Bacillus cereus group TaxID=86661 RepID=UPI0002DF3FE8|nr:Tn7-like element transposition protein TnsE [Bacillus anthracis]MEC4695285.1 Tn7-like element transposition protein TnsE [Bacillus anthracis]
MKLRPWTFGNNLVTLKWLGNVNLKHNQWFIRVAFEYNSQIEMLEFPIAAIPLLKVGAKYQDGICLDTQRKGIIYDVKIQNLGQYRVVSALDACKKFGYYLHANKELMHQLAFELFVEGKTYYIPQTEFVRAVFAINKIMSNAMLRPNGLELLVNRAELNGNTASIDLVDEIPNAIARDKDFIRYFAWLYFNIDLKKSFESIYTNIYGELSNQQELKLEVNLPAIPDVFIRFRGIEKDNNYLILEWLGSDMAETLFTDIEVKHKAFKKQVTAPEKRKYRKSIQDTGEKVLNENANNRSKQDINQPITDISGAQLQFKNAPKVHKVYGSEQQVNQGDMYISNDGKGGGVKTEKVVGLDESIYGGHIQPIEFKALEVTSDIRGQGLEKFIKMIQLLAKCPARYEISLNFVYLPLGRKFSYLPDGKRRACAIVNVKNKVSNKKYCVIEISIPDDRTLSTLIIEVTSEGELEQVISKILKGLVFNSGSWDKKSLSKILSKRIKHVNQDLYDWKKRLELNFK